jgi:H+/Cl- antiporter ClcA
MLDDFLQETWNAKLPSKNLTYALLGLGFSVLASVASYLALDTFKPRAGHSFLWAVILFYFVLTAVSGVYAFMACKNALKSLRSNKNIKNYIALIIGCLLLLGIGRQMLSHF